MTLLDLLATVGVIGILAGSVAAGAAAGADRTRVVLQGEVATAFRRPRRPPGICRRRSPSGSVPSR
ncbi:MAG: hypothetical protein R2882_04395 [Gemmatimonadales bacterium]